MRQRNNLVLCDGVIYIVTRKYQGAFCCSQYGVENFLDFNSLLSMKLVYKKLRLMWLNTEETLQGAATFIIYNKNKDIRLQIVLYKLEIFCFPFTKKCLVMLCTFKIISTLSCMLCLMNELGREEHCVIISSSLRTSLN